MTTKRLDTAVATPTPRAVTICLVTARRTDMGDRTPMYLFQLDGEWYHDRVSWMDGAPPADWRDGPAQSC